MTREQLEMENKALRAALLERVFCAFGAEYDREGFTFDTDHDTALRDINYRDCRLYPTAEEALAAEVAYRLNQTTALFTTTMSDERETNGQSSDAAPCSPLFEDRTPEAAAIQLAIVLAWLTECNLVTLEEMRSRKRTPKYSIARQQSICEKAVEHCLDMKVPPRGLRGQTTTRLARILRENAKG